jgi:soluble lytic murein transglycosylase
VNYNLLLDTPLIYQYKGVMKFIRPFVWLWIITLLTACGLPALPTIPPGWTLTPSISPTAPPSPTPTITPTPVPVVRVEAGDLALFNGDYPTALVHFQTAFRDSSDPIVRASAKWGEARTLYEDGRFPETLSALQTLIMEYPDSSHIPQAQFLQGQTQYQLQQYEQAAISWHTYLTLQPGVLDSYTQELRGDALYEAGIYADALTAYTAAIQAPRLEDTALLEIKAADTRRQLKDYDAALAMYDGLLSRPVNDYIKAQAVYEAGLVYQDQGRMDEAFEKYRFGVDNYPLSNYSYLGLVQLVEAGAAVDDLNRGLVDYFAGQYEGALAAFDRYLAANPINDGTAHFYRALTLRALDNPDAAVLAFTTFIENYSPHPRWVEAWSEKADTEWLYRGLSTNAEQTLLDFVKVMPNTTAAPDYLFKAARILESDDHLEEAEQIWERVANEYPDYDQTPTAIFEAGILHYRLQDYSGALAEFNRSLAISVQPEDQARAYLWIGKAQQKLSNASDVMTAWQQGQITDPGGYYSERTRDLLMEREPFTPPTSENLNFDMKSERADADAWVRLTFNLPVDTDLSGPGALADDPRFIRGKELWQLGLYEKARAEFENLRDSISSNAVDTYRLANYLLDLGLYRSAIYATRQTLTLAGLEDQPASLMAPPYFSHMRYGLYYSDLVIPDAQVEGLDPLLLFSLVRQESLFEGFIKSQAGARGLMQIMPGTGTDLSGQLGWPPEYDEADLYRPDVSIRLGAHYLASNRRAMEGDLYAALAAYNAGPGFAVTWKGITGNDPDLFLEVIRAQETRDYIRSVYENYLVYTRLYSQTPP